MSMAIACVSVSQRRQYYLSIHFHSDNLSPARKLNICDTIAKGSPFNTIPYSYVKLSALKCHAYQFSENLTIVNDLRSNNSKL